jgi:hypothetical protein
MRLFSIKIILIFSCDKDKKEKGTGSLQIDTCVVHGYGDVGGFGILR